MVYGGGGNDLKPLYRGIARGGGLRWTAGVLNIRFDVDMNVRHTPPPPPLSKNSVHHVNFERSKEEAGRLLNKLLANGRTGSYKDRY